MPDLPTSPDIQVLNFCSEPSHPGRVHNLDRELQHNYPATPYYRKVLYANLWAWQRELDLAGGDPHADLAVLLQPGPDLCRAVQLGARRMPALQTW